ncbi:MAG: PEP-CTERM sorting domain-containing protein [Sedimentisphaerales bacterium]|nr:PEP-CTERM sorting domain-containing protein [Sedimentisphaerales bacterium]
MSREKKFLCALLSICIIMYFIPAAFADGTIEMQIGRYGTPNYGYDGELIITVLSGLPELPTQFGSFCLELDEPISAGINYNAVINTEAIKGGEATSDPLSPKTAWLYDQYLTGAITFSDDYDATQFQYAVWALEDEIAPGYDVGNGIYWNSVAADYYNAAMASDWQDIGNIRVLNMGTAANNYCYQDILAPIPEPATIFLLTLGGLILIKRK